MSKIILIGGAPTVGKTDTAKRISKRLTLPWISTDGIRAMLRKVVDEKDLAKKNFQNSFWGFYGGEINKK